MVSTSSLLSCARSPSSLVDGTQGRGHDNEVPFGGSVLGESLSLCLVFLKYCKLKVIILSSGTFGVMCPELLEYTNAHPAHKGRPDSWCVYFQSPQPLQPSPHKGNPGKEGSLSPNQLREGKI